MREWHGVDDTKTPMGEGTSSLTNVSFLVDGQLRRRPGLSARYVMSAVLLSLVEHPTAGAFLVSADGSGNLIGSDLPTGTAFTIASSLSPDIQGCFTNVNSKGYYTNDFNTVQRFERGDAVSVNAGIVAPTVTPTNPGTTAGTITAGSHRFRYRYRDTRTLYVSNPSAELTVVTTASAVNIGVTLSSDAKVNQIILEVTAVGGTEFFLAATSTNATGNIAFTMIDETLQVQLSTDSYYGDFGHEPPPKTELICEHRGRVFAYKTSKRTRTSCTVSNGSPTISGTSFPTNNAWDGRLILVNSETAPYIIASTTATTITLSTNYGGSASGAANTITIYHPQPDQLYWSRAGFPESFKPLSWARRVMTNGDQPTAIFSAYGSLWVCGGHTLRRLDYTSDPAAAKVETVPGDAGVYNQRCVVNADGRNFLFGASGVFELKGGMVDTISKPVDQTVETLIDRAQAESFHGWYDPYERSLTFAFCRTGDTVPKDAICFHLDSEEWTFRKWRNGIRCSTLAGSATVSFRPYLGDVSGYVWRVKENHPDGPATELSTPILGILAGSTTTVLNVSNSLPTTASLDLRGCVIYSETDDEARVCSSNTAGTVTVSPAFTSAPTPGDLVYVGSIGVETISDWWYGPTLQSLKAPPYLAIEHENTNGIGVRMNIQVFKRWETTGTAFTKGANDTPPSNVTLTNGSATAVLVIADTGQEGCHYIPVSSDRARLWRYTIECNDPTGDFALLDARFLLTNKRQVSMEVIPT